MTLDKVCNLAIWPDLTKSAVRSIVSFMTQAFRIDSDPLFDESPLSLPSEGRSQNLLDSAKKLSCGLYILELG